VTPSDDRGVFQSVNDVGSGIPVFKARAFKKMPGVNKLLAWCVGEWDEQAFEHFSWPLPEPEPNIDCSDLRKTLVAQLRPVSRVIGHYLYN
jgi:hypothetical protein